MQYHKEADALEELVKSLADPTKRIEAGEGLKNYIKNLENNVKNHPSAESFVLIGRVRL